METQQIQAVNRLDATEHSVRRMHDTDDNNTTQDREEDDVSLSDDKEIASVKAKVAGHDEDADKVAPAPSLVRSIVNGVLGAFKSSKRPSDRDSDDHNEDCSIQSLDISIHSLDISMLEASRYPRRGALAHADLLRSAILAQSLDISRTSDSIQSSDCATTLEDDGQELCNHVLVTRNERAQQSADVDDATQEDTALALRLKDFHHARDLWSETYRTILLGIFCIFVMLADVRLDLAWAEDAARRRGQGKPVFSWGDFQRLHRKYRPCPFTYLIMIVSTATLVLSIYLNGWKFAPLKDNPAYGPDPSILIDLGGLLTSKIVEENEWYRLVTSIVLHAGIFHYVTNMLLILLYGSVVERVHGTMKTAAVFMLSGVGGSLASANFGPNSVSVGTSGGIFGLMGFCLADILTNWDLLTISDSKRNQCFSYRSAILIFCLSVDVVISLSLGLMPIVDNFAHLGGFLFGICFGLSLLWRSGTSDFFGQMTLARHYRRYAYAVIGTVVATCVFTAMVMLLLDSDGRTTVCPWCRHLSCAPFPFWTKDKWWNCDECDQSLGRIVRLQNTSELDLTCPNGDIVTIPLMDPDPEQDDIMNRLIGYCRQFC
jgi:membrane associated rhomboid family serine protease